MIDPNAVVALLEAEYLSLLGKIAELPAEDFSDQGRSSSGTGARASIQTRLEAIEAKLAQLGAPVGKLGLPVFAVTSTHNEFPYGRIGPLR